MLASSHSALNHGVRTRERPERDVVIEAAAGALRKVLAGKDVSELRRGKILRQAYAAIQEEGEWPTERRVRLWGALREAAGL